MEETKMTKKPLHGSIVDLPDAPGVFFPGATKKVVFGPTHFWPDYVMRCWILDPSGGEADTHHHPWPHWVVCIDGECVNVIDDDTFDMKAGDWMFVPGGSEHLFRNKSDKEKCSVLCIVPPEGDIPIDGKGC